MNKSWHFNVAEMMKQLPGEKGVRFATAFHDGSMILEIYAPRGTDPQQPHEQDEIYVVVKGRGRFVRGSETVQFVEGDVLLVPARMVHRFEDFTDDLIVWVVFYGSENR